MKKWMRRWRQQSKLERMENWREKGQAAVHCPIFLLNFPAVLAATFLLHVCLLSFISFPHKPLRLSLLLHFSKIFPCPEGFLLPNFLYFIIPYIGLCCIPFLIIFSISLWFTGSSPSSFIALFLRLVLTYLHVPVFFQLVPSSCRKLHDSASRLPTLHFLRTNHCLYHPLHENLCIIPGNLLELL